MRAIAPQAIFGRKAAVVEAPPAPVKKSLFGGRPAKAAPAKKASSTTTLPKQSILEAFDFSQARSQDDAELIARARGMRAGQKMSREQYQALRRKVGGTAKDYWKGWVDVKGANVDKGYVVSEAESTSLPPAIGLLAATVVGMIAVLGVVATRT